MLRTRTGGRLQAVPHEDTKLRSQWSEREQPSVKSNPTSNRRRGCVNVWTPERKTDHEASVECQPVDLSPGPELGQKSTFLVLYPRWQALMFT